MVQFIRNKHMAFNNMSFSRIDFTLVDLKKIDYHNIKDHHHRKDFVISLLNIKKTDRKDVLFSQYQLNPDSIPHLLKSLLTNHPERMLIFKKYAAYNKLKNEIKDFIFSNLKTNSYENIRNNDQRKNFVMSLLQLNAKERHDVLIAQYQLNPDSIPHLLKSILANHPERKAIFEQCTAYEHTKKDLICFLAIVSPERLTQEMRGTNLTSINSEEITALHELFIFYEKHKNFVRIFKTNNNHQKLFELDAAAKEIFIRGQLDSCYQDYNKQMIKYRHLANAIQDEHIKEKKDEEAIKEKVINKITEHCLSIYEQLTKDLKHFDRAVTFVAQLLNKIRFQEFSISKSDTFSEEGLAAKKISLYGDVIPDVTSYRYMYRFINNTEASSIESYIYTILLHLERTYSLPNNKQLDCLDEVFSFARVFLVKILSFIPADQFDSACAPLKISRDFFPSDLSHYDKPFKLQRSPESLYITQSNPQSLTSRIKFFPASTFGIRTEAMVETLPRFVDFNGTKFREYTIIARDITDFVGQKLVSIGAVSGSNVINRELITLDPSSVYLIDMYAALKQYLIKWRSPDQTALSTRQVLEQIMMFIRTRLGSYKNEEGIVKCDVLINEWSIRKNKEDATLFAKTIDGVSAPIIPVDEFIKKQACVCRHHALITAYLLQKSAIDGLVRDGEIHINRDNIVRPDRTSGHSWVVFKTKYNVYVVDTMWNKKPYDLEKEQKKLILFYKEFALNNMTSRYLKKQESPNLYDIPISIPTR